MYPSIKEVVTTVNQDVKVAHLHPISNDLYGDVTSTALQHSYLRNGVGMEDVMPRVVQLVPS